jgi:quercetin dioxygenase-like cupin family protein
LTPSEQGVRCSRHSFDVKILHPKETAEQEASMSTAVEKGYGFAGLEELEAAPILAPGATDDGRRRFDVRRRLGITSFGIQAFSAPKGIVVINEHDEIQLVEAEAGQEELYVVLDGAATFEIDGESFEVSAGSFVHVRPTSKRKATATADGTTILVVGGTPGKAYEPSPEEARDAFAAYTTGDYETAIAKQLVVVEKRPSDPVAHFNAGCFAARAGRTDEAIEHLRRAVEISERVKELMAKDEDLDSIRDDPRFAELVT